MIVLTPLKKFQFPIYAECITPEVFEGKNAAEIAELSVFEGNKQKKLGDLFKIEEDPAATPNITINGDAGEVRRIGMEMKKGEIVINGNAGMHLGEKMKGGKITVNGDAGGWTGSDMKGGLIEIHGNTSDYLFRKTVFFECCYSDLNMRSFFTGYNFTNIVEKSSRSSHLNICSKFFGNHTSQMTHFYRVI